jgi:hypothetical protein
MQKKGHGQRVKYTSLILVLVIDVVTLVSIPMTYFFLRNQRQLMAQGLYDKIELTLQNLSSSAAEIIQPSGFFPPYIKSQDLRSISNRGAAIEEVEFVTITAGPASDSDIEYFDLDPDERELIWYTNDPMLFASNIQIHEYLRRHGLNVEGDPIQLLNVENSVLPEYYRRSTDPYVETIFWRRTRISDPLSQRIAGNEGSGESDIARMLALNANEQFSTVREDISTVFSQLLNSRSDEEIQELHSQLDVLWERQDAIVPGGRDPQLNTGVPDRRVRYKLRQIPLLLSDLRV